MLWEEERRPQQVQLLEVEEEEDESKVFADSWGDTQVLAGEAQVQAWVMGDQGCQLGRLGVINMNRNPS